jgi:hypothetical protein
MANPQYHPAITLALQTQLQKDTTSYIPDFCNHPRRVLQDSGASGAGEL